MLYLKIYAILLLIYYIGTTIIENTFKITKWEFGGRVLFVALLICTSILFLVVYCALYISKLNY